MAPSVYTNINTAKKRLQDNLGYVSLYLVTFGYVFIPLFEFQNAAPRKAVIKKQIPITNYKSLSLSYPIIATPKNATAPQVNSP